MGFFFQAVLGVYLMCPVSFCSWFIFYGSVVDFCGYVRA